MSGLVVRLLEAADEELRGAVGRYLVVANPKIAGMFLNMLEETLALVKHNP